jgi:hypothetical protein
MTYAKFEQTHTDDERWIEAGADAFAVHVAAIVYCDRQLTDGRITDAMARRVSLPVPTQRAEAAVATLVEKGFWRATDAGYVIEKFHEHAFPAEQVKRTQERWKADKARRRQHSLGEHSLCKDPKFCPAIREGASTVESTEDGTVESTRIDQTRPDQTGGRVWDGKGDGGSASGGGSAALAAPSPPPPRTTAPAWAEGPPPGTKFYVNGKEVTP